MSPPITNPHTLNHTISVDNLEGTKFKNNNDWIKVKDSTDGNSITGTRKFNNDDLHTTYKRP